MTKTRLKHYTSAKYIEYHEYHKYVHSYIWLHTGNSFSGTGFNWTADIHSHTVAVLHEQTLTADLFM